MTTQQTLFKDTLEQNSKMSSLESKIASFRSRNPLQPIPFELFPEFCQSWIENYYEDKEAVLSQLSDFKAQTNHLGEEPVKDESKIGETKIRKQTKPHPDQVNLSGAMRLYGRISEDCIKLDRGLRMIRKKLERLEPDVKELEILGEVLSKNAAKFVRPSAKKMGIKVTELEQMEKELLNVELEDNEEEVK